MNPLKAASKPKAEIKAQDVMTKHPITVSSDPSLVAAASLMLKKDSNAVAVVNDQGRLVGLLTDDDFLHRTELQTEKSRSYFVNLLFGTSLSAKEYTRSHGLMVSDVMTRDVVSATEQTPVVDIVSLMERHKIKHVPILRGHELVGMIGVGNLMRAVVKIRSAPAAGGSPAQIRNRILREIGKQGWTTGSAVDVSIHNGVADLWGTICDEEQRDALKVLALSTPGVSQVEDHLTWESDSEP